MIEPALAVKLYDASLGTLPESQGWTMGTGTPGSSNLDDWYVDNGVLHMPLQYGTSETAEGFALPPKEHPLIEPMVLSDGFQISWDLRVTNHIGTSFGAFVVWMVSDTPGRGIHFGFTDNQVYLYRGNPTYAQKKVSLANYLPGYQTSDWVDYQLDVLGNDYSLRADGIEILFGQLEQFTHPYYSAMRNSLCFGNDNAAASGHAEMTHFTQVPEPATLMLVVLGGLGMRCRK